MTHNIAPEIDEYFWEKYNKCGIKVVPGHWPVMTTKEDVDRWIGLLETMNRISSDKHLPEYDRDLTHEEVKNIFYDTYNNYYLKRMNAKTDAEFESMWKEVKDLNRKYNCALCKDVLMHFSTIIHRRAGNGKQG